MAGNIDRGKRHWISLLQAILVAVNGGVAGPPPTGRARSSTVQNAHLSRISRYAPSTCIDEETWNDRVPFCSNTTTSITRFGSARWPPPRRTDKKELSPSFRTLYRVFRYKPFR